MTAKQLTGAFAPDGSKYVTLTDGAGNLSSSNLTIGTSAISGGATTQVLFNLAGVVSSDSGFTYLGSGGYVTSGGFRVGGADHQIYTTLAGAQNLTNSLRSGLFGLSVTGVSLAANYNYSWSSNNAGSGDVFGTTDTILSRGAAATLQLGAANAASPVSQTLQTQGSRSGTDSNVGGATLTIKSGIGTGTGTVSSLLLQSPIAVGSGTGAQTSTTGLAIKNGSAVLTNYIVANLPSASTSGAGALAFVTDSTATAITGLGLAVVGSGANKVVVYSDGTSWLIL